MSSSSWKIKNNCNVKNNKSNKHQTQTNVGLLHKNIFNEFNEKKNNIDMYKNKLNELIDTRESFQKTYNSSNESKKNILDKLLIDINNQINYHETLINDIENNTSEMNYYDKTYNILLEYYSNEKKDNDNEKNDNSTQNENTILKYLTNFNSSDKKCTERIVKKKAKLYNDYMNMTNSVIKNNKCMENMCMKCNIKKLFIEDYIVCNNCGEIDNFIMENEQNSNKNTNANKQKYPYKRLNHLVEWLNQFQAKELTHIPNNVCNNIIEEINKSKINDVSTLTNRKMKALLKQLKYHQYYEHIPYIMSKITKNPPPSLSRNMEEEIKKMFKQIQEPFKKHCPSARTNFLSYSYVLHKIFQLLDLKQYKNFSLLKSRDKLRMQDDIWKLICTDLNWNFIPSI
jgi:hypothetical protein